MNITLMKGHDMAGDTTRRVQVNIIRDVGVTKSAPSDRYKSITTPASAHIPALEVLKVEMQRLPQSQRLAIMNQYCHSCGANKENEVCRCFEA
jgi:hypothetical protein